MVAPGSEQAIGMPAGDPVRGAVLQQRRIRRATFVGGEPAARREAAALRQIEQRGNHAPDLGQPRTTGCAACRDIDVGNGAQQALRVGMAGLLEQVVDGCLLDLSAGVHHHHPVGGFGDHAHVVGDQDDRGAERVLQLAHEVEDLRLDGHVERGCWFVGDQNLRDCTTAPWRSSRAGACRRRAGADRRALASPPPGCARGAASRWTCPARRAVTGPGAARWPR